MKTTVIRTRIDESLKKEVEAVLDKLGLSMSEAIKLYMTQIKLHQGIPFDIKVPNNVTLETFHDTDDKRNLIRSKNIDEISKKLKI